MNYPPDLVPFLVKGDRRLYRTAHGGRPVVLKWFEDAEAGEIRAYALLQSLEVPTLPVLGRAEQMLLLEDLEQSEEWRQATEIDVTEAEVGAAIARWYKALHRAGHRLLANPADSPSYLSREEDALDAATILDLGRRLDLENDPVWQLAADNIEVLKDALRSLPQTLTHNDFHWTNLALSRGSDAVLQAVVYDYHLLGIGVAYSDCRNVASALRERAQEAFWETYGDVDQREALLDAPMATIYALSLAVQRTGFPGWAVPLRREAESGELLDNLQQALAAVQRLESNIGGSIPANWVEDSG